MFAFVETALSFLLSEHMQPSLAQASLFYSMFSFRADILSVASTELN